MNAAFTESNEFGKDTQHIHVANIEQFYVNNSYILDI